jgi:hypothetical protein
LCLLLDSVKPSRLSKRLRGLVSGKWSFRHRETAERSFAVSRLLWPKHRLLLRHRVSEVTLPCLKVLTAVSVATLVAIHLP